MIDAEKEAMEWLRGLIGAFPSRSDPAVTLLALLAEPRLPAEPSAELLLAMRRSEIVPSADWRDHFLHAYRALYVELTAPKPKTVEVWRVESAYHGHTRIWQANDGSKSNADQMAAYLATDGHTCIHVTGPHTQEVPNA